MVKNKYRNYAEQVEDNVTIIGLCNDLNEIDEFYWEAMFDAAYEMATDEQVLESYEGEPISTDSSEFCELRMEYVSECLESVYQLYKVELKGEWNYEHERLELFWNDTIQSYVMPVYQYGIAWSMCGAYN